MKLLNCRIYFTFTDLEWGDFSAISRGYWGRGTALLALFVILGFPSATYDPIQGNADFDSWPGRGGQNHNLVPAAGWRGSYHYNYLLIDFFHPETIRLGGDNDPDNWVQC